MTDKTQDFNGKTVTLPCRACGNRFEQVFDSRKELKLHCHECDATADIVPVEA